MRKIFSLIFTWFPIGENENRSTSRTNRSIDFRIFPGKISLKNKKISSNVGRKMCLTRPRSVSENRISTTSNGVELSSSSPLIIDDNFWKHSIAFKRKLFSKIQSNEFNQRSQRRWIWTRRKFSVKNGNFHNVSSNFFRIFNEKRTLKFEINENFSINFFGFISIVKTLVEFRFVRIETNKKIPADFYGVRRKSSKKIFQRVDDANKLFVFIEEKIQIEKNSSMFTNFIDDLIRFVDKFFKLRSIIWRHFAFERRLKFVENIFDSLFEQKFFVIGQRSNRIVKFSNDFVGFFSKFRQRTTRLINFDQRKRNLKIHSTPNETFVERVDDFSIEINVDQWTFLWISF